MIRVGCLLLVFLVILPPVIASRYLSAGGVVLLLFAELALLMFAVPRLLKFGVTRFAMNLFTAKSRVLRGATAIVHEVRPTGRPMRSADAIVESAASEAIDPPRATATVTGYSDTDAALVHKLPLDSRGDDDARFVQVELTLRPKPGQSPMQLFDVDDLLLVPFDQRVAFGAPNDGPSGTVEQVFFRTGSLWRSPEGKLTLEPEQNLRLIFRCPPDLRGRVKFRYYFEAFGDLTLPE